MEALPNTTLLAPSLLAANHADLKTGLAHIENAGLSWVHLDIMDGHFVPNLSFGPKTVDDLRKLSTLYFDVHLMLDNPNKYIESFIAAGANQITIHVEPEYPIAETLSTIRDSGVKCGIALNPDTPVEAALPYLEYCDMVLLMTVVPGFGGQVFRQDVLPKIKRIAQLRTEGSYNFRIQVDGGVDLESAPACLEHGVDTLVAGTSFFNAKDPVAFEKAILNQ
jgi:ribulose-phosphate 3-epimerase